MRRWKEYYTPSTVDEALMLLGQYNGSARIIAGGTDLILDMEAGHTEAPDVLVDVTKIVGIEEIYQESDADGEWIIIGAGVTHYQGERHRLLGQVGTCLTESCRVVGGPQVRNVATLGGNVAHALPAADGTIGLLALDAQVEVCTLQGGEVGRAWQPLLSIFAGPGRNTLDPHQMLSAFRFRPTGDGEGSAFDRIMRPQGVALPILGLAARVRLDAGRKRVEDATIAIGPAGPIPFRATEAEAILKATATFDDTVMEAVIAAAQGQARLRTSKHRASQDYRHEMIAVLLRRVLPKAVARARGN
jgi:CO/xanthine dehydrogenase FAD-binding subunit